GPAKALFTKNFYQLCSDALTNGGIVVTQNGVLADKKPENLAATKLLKEAGLAAGCYLVSVPSYYGGSMALGYACKSSQLITPPLDTLRERFQDLNLDTQHYSPEIHRATFTLPRWAAKLIKESVTATKAAA